MRRLLGPIVIAFSCLLVAGSSALAAETDWLDDYEKALSKGRKAALPILVAFTNNSSETCRALNENVFRDSKFILWSSKTVVLLTIDSPEKESQDARLRKQNDALLLQFKVEDFPTVLLLSTDGTESGRLGYAGEDAEEWIEKVEPIVESAASCGKWLTDFEKAMRIARARRRPILAFFTGSDWCSWCTKLEKEVFDTPEFKEWARQNVVLLEVDLPWKTKLPEDLTKQNESLKKKYWVQAFPTTVFIDLNEKVLGRSGYLEGGPSKWIEDAEKKMGLR